MAIKRRKYSPEFVSQVMEAVNNRSETQESMTAIAKRFSLDRTYLYVLVKSMAKKPTQLLKKEIESKDKEIRNSKDDPRDHMIYQLKNLVADLTLKINELEARLGGYKRYADKRLYSPSRPDSV